MKPLPSPVRNVGTLHAITAEEFATRMASSGPQRLGWALTISTGLRFLRPERGSTCRQKRQHASVRFHMAAPTERRYVVGRVVARIAIAVMPVYPRLSALHAWSKLEKTPCPIALCIRRSSIALPRLALWPAHYWLIRPSQIPSSTHCEIISECQRCHLRYDLQLHIQHSRETRRNRKALGDLFKPA